MGCENKRKHKYNPLYKNFLNLKTNPLNNNKFLAWKSTLKYKKLRWSLTKRSSRKKWEHFLDSQIRSQSFFNRFRPHNTVKYKANKFASQANSYRKNFKKNLLAKTTFNFLYGGFSKRHLRTQMASIYRLSNVAFSKNSCAEFFESKLESVLYKSKFFTSVRNARQWVTHKHVKVNGVVEKNKNYLLKEGDIVTFTQKTRKFIKKNIEEKYKKCPDFIIWPIPSQHLYINYKTLEISIGKIKNFNFSNSFTFKLETWSVVKNNYRY